MSNQLLPCPFCGGDAQMAESDTVYWVKCTQCKSEGATNAYSAKAISAWNRRATQPAAGEPVAWIVVEEPFHGVKGIQSGEWDIELDAKAIESLAKDNSPGRIALFTAAQPAAGEPVAWMIDWPDEPELGHYFSESPDELTGSRSRPLFTAAPPAAAHGDEAVRKDREIGRRAIRAALPNVAGDLLDHGLAAALSAMNGDSHE